MAAASQYLKCNVYYSKHAWLISAWVMTAGKPYGRAIRTVVKEHELGSAVDLASALHAASEHLAKVAAEL